MRALSAVVIVGCLFVFGSCATVSLDATTIQKQPVQMNQAGEPNYDVVADFTVKDKAAWIIGIIPVNKPAGDHNDYLATLLQSEIDKAGGDAVINVKIMAQNAIEDVAVNIITLGVYVPRTVTVTGQVIKYR